MCESFPFLILPVRQLSPEPFGKHRMRRTIRRTGPTRVSRRARHRARFDRTIRRSDASEPSGKTPGPSRIKSSAEAPRASRRARLWAHLEWNPPPKHRERTVGQDAMPDSNHTPKQYTSDPSGKPPGPSRSMRHRTSRHVHPAVYRAIHRASRCHGAEYDPALKPQPAGAADTELNPLDYSL